MGHYCMRSCLRRRNGTRIRAQFTACERSSPKLTLRRKLSSGDKVFFSPAPTEILWMTVVSSVATFRATIEQPTKAHTVFQVSWPNIGPAAAGSAGPAPTALTTACKAKVDTQYQYKVVLFMKAARQQYQQHKSVAFPVQ